MSEFANSNNENNENVENNENIENIENIEPVIDNVENTDNTENIENREDNNTSENAPASVDESAPLSADTVFDCGESADAEAALPENDINIAADAAVNDSESITASESAFASEFTPEFDAFYANFNGDKSNPDKVLDAFVAERESVLPQHIPAFIRDTAGKKYTEFNYCVSVLEVSSVDDIAAPLSVLYDKRLEVKKIFIFNSTPEAVFTAAFERVITTIKLDDEAFLKLYNGVAAFFKRESRETLLYCVAFENAIEKLYRTQIGELGRIGICLSLRNTAFTRLNNYFESDAPKCVLSDEDIANLKAKFERVCMVYYDDAAANKYDLKTAHLFAIDKAVKLHNEKYHRLAEDARIGAAEFVKLDAVSKSLAAKNSYELDVQMLDMIKVYSDYPNVINFYAAKYAIRKRSTIGNGSDPVFTELAKSLGRIRTIATLVFDESPEVALYLAAAYAPLSEAAVTMISMVRNNTAVFNNLDARVADAACRGAIKKLHARMASEGLSDETEQNVYTLLNSFPNKKSNETVGFKLAGNVKIFYRVMCDAWRAYRRNVGFNPKKKSKKGLVWAIVILALVAIAAVGAVLAIKFNLISFGGNPSQDNSDASGTVSDVSTPDGFDASDNSNNSDSSDSSDFSDGFDNSDISDNDNSDTSDTSDNSDVSGGDTSTPDTPAKVDYITVSGNGTPGDSSVSLLDKTYSGSVWKRVIILTPDTENKGLYIVSAVKSVVARVELAENEIALAFSVAEDDNKASVEAMLTFTESFVTGVTRLASTDNKTFTVAEIRPVPDNALLIDYYNQALVDNQAIMYCGKEKVSSYLSTQTPAGYVVLLAPDEGKNTFKVVETLNESLSFTTAVDPEKMIIIVFHWRKTGTTYEAAKARVEAAKEQFAVGASVEVFGFDFVTLKRTPESNTPIYVAAVE